MGTPTDELPPDESKKPVRIAIKLKPTGQPQKELTGLDLHGKATALALFSLVKIRDEKKFDDLIARAQKVNPEARLPDFSSWYQVLTPPGINPDELVATLCKLKNVETAYAMRPVPPPVDPAHRNISQGYVNSAPIGIDALYAWGSKKKGNDGAGVGFVDIEQGWNLLHEDLPPTIPLVSGVNYYYFGHGTSVLGQILMADNVDPNGNPKGGLGIAPAASCRVVSQWRNTDPPATTDPHNNVLEAIYDAIWRMHPGDVLLLEAQEDADKAHDPTKAVDGYWPVEVVDLTYQAIKLATDGGIVVVEAAGNGTNNLDASYQKPSGKRIFDTASPDFRDSGAIMVGAALSGDPHVRLASSNYGKRIDCYAWGTGIYTTSTNTSGTANAAYTAPPAAGFGSTSGASAIVAGAALVVQGLAKAKASRGNKPFTPKELRRILTANGTPLAGRATDVIGVMPDLQAIIINNQL